MAEELNRRPRSNSKQRKTFASNQSLTLDQKGNDNCMAQVAKKKGRPPKDANTTVIMNTHNNTSHVSSNSSTSKTVAAILKQVKESLPAKEAMRVQQQQQQALKKKNKTGQEQIQSSNILNQLKTTSSPLGRVGSPSLVISPALSPSGPRGVSPLGKDHSHPVTTKSSSLSRDLSPSRITAQMVKVMAETAPNTQPSNTTNLLRSALQGSMPDPIGILSSTKTEGGLVSVVTSTGGSITSFNQNRKSTGVSSFSKNLNIVSSSANPTHTFSKILTNIAGGGGYLSQQSLEGGDSCSPTMTTLSTVENLLASSDGTIQTVNVSHIPKSTNPNSSTIGGLPGTSSSSISPRPSPRSAMEVAQQIKMEANGQKSSALRPGMQQHLRTQIQGSRSIDAQLAPKQIQGSRGIDSQIAPKQIQLATNKSQSSSQRASPKDTESKPKDVNMPLLTAKLTALPSVVKVSQTIKTQLKQQPQQHPLSADLLSLTISSSSTPSSTTVSTLPISTLNKRPQQFTANVLPELKPRFHLQSTQQQPAATLSIAKPSQHLSEDHTWLPRQQNVQADSRPPALNLSGGLGEILSGLDKHQTLEKLIQASISGTMGVQSDKVDGHAQSINKHLSIHSNLQRGKSPSQVTSVQPNVEKIVQDFINQKTMVGGSLKISSNISTAQTVSKYRLGDSQQTAIDVDMDIGHLASITGEGSIIKNDTAAAKDVRGSQVSSFNQKLPVKSTALFTFHTLQTTSSLAHIPKPIVHTSAAPSVTLSVAQSQAVLPPPPDYTPPPPYPGKLSQQYPQSLTTQQQQLFFPSKASQSSKQAVQNPFTFPIKHTLDRDGPSSKQVQQVTYQKSITENTENIINASNSSTVTKFREPKVTSSNLVKPQAQADAVPFQIKLEIKNEPLEVKAENQHFQTFNHVAEPKKKQLQPFNQRISNLSCFPVMNSTYRAAYRSHVVAVQRARAGVITNTAKSLDILRQNLQRAINKELTEIIKRYTDKYFQPALENIKQNNNEPFLGDEHINYVCRQILEEAKSEYISETGRRSVTPSDIPDNISESGSLGGRRMFLKRSRISDSDSEKGSDPGDFRRKIAKKKGKPSFYGGSGRVTPSKPYKPTEPIRREGPKWDPDRIKPETLFVMGARANKALGLGNTRGRLYIRHPDVFKYIGDQEDKVWLCEHNLMPATGGKAYMLLLEDIEDLSKSDDYKDSPGLMMHECIGFTVPEWMLLKMKEQMKALRSDATKRSLSQSPVSDIGDSRPKSLPFSSFSDTGLKEETMVSPADTEDMDFLSTADNDDTQPSSGISPFTVSGGFDEGVSPSPSDLDPIEDPAPVPSLFS
ncbi:mucin-5AC-like isoform X1 [Biomphalaria glabrata]|uniref:Mucin-5AC-like isoform X1 n=2 Tax=Biomphalaria glabrata TaxID=6526 RepID=A0A9W2YFG6_BIOGL|nr:mucin-5AC-like isoform X1 [Biomphalaria glabrata]